MMAVLSAIAGGLVVAAFLALVVGALLGWWIEKTWGRGR